MKLKFFTFILAFACMVAFSASTFAQNKNEELKKAQDRVNNASEVLREIMGDPDKAIPQELLSKAQAVVVFPGVIKGAFIVGGQGGNGVMVRKLANGWSAPAFLNVGGASFGAQIGGEKIDYILLIMNDGGLNGLLQDKFEMGGEAGVAAGPVGRTVAASTNATLDAAILTYSRSKGAFAGVALKGAVISQDQDINRAIYNKDARDLLIISQTPMSAAPKSLQKFPQTVAQFAK